MRAVALGSLGALAVIGLMLAFMQGQGGEWTSLLAGVAAFLVFEYIILRALIVPRVANYGRFRVYENKVDFYPLSFSGLSISAASDSEPITSFKGLTIKRQADKDRYQVFLMHKEPGRSVCLKTYHAPEPAKGHAEALADALRVGYAPQQNNGKPLRAQRGVERRT